MIDLDTLWAFAVGITGESHGFSRGEAAKIKAAIRAPRKKWTERTMSARTDVVAAQYAESCFRDLRRAAAFIKATGEHDAAGMIANAGDSPGFSKEPDIADWVTCGAEWYVYFQHATPLVRYLRRAHPTLAADWRDEVESRLRKAKEAMRAHAPGGEHELGKLYRARITSYLIGAATEAEEIHDALVKIVGVAQTASRGEPLLIDALIRLAGLQGPDAKYKPIGRLLATLRSMPDVWQSVFVLSGKKKGKAHKSTTTALHQLKEKRLAEVKPAGKSWRLGAAAFPDKGATKGATI